MIEALNKNVVQRRDFNSYINHPGSVSGICLTRTNEIILINTKRYGRTQYFELPGGMIEEGEEPINALSREVYEETGYKVISCELIGKYHTSGGITNELVHLYHCIVEEDAKTIVKEFEIVKINKQKLKELINNGETEDFRIKIAANFISYDLQDLNNSYSRIISLWSIQESLLQVYRSIFITTQSLLFSISVFIATTEKPYFSALLFPIGIYLLWFGFRITRKRGFGVWYCILHIHKLDKRIPVDIEGFTTKLHNFMELKNKEKILHFKSDVVGREMLNDRTRSGMDFRVSFFFLFLWIILLLLIIFIKYLPDIV